ncbi:hypothetical protein [Streptomyces marincola]|uniref:Uncharacterized protein n=1 Tax=Streptomyces marincola TaxID=2878388 RepID=A0A1W7D5R0_9ACTN|nr:hypothetical protein [Streptomyces marincola]ARQ71930.1 hypothetical protein CAG99_26615 [Streptomyces marincola]
MSVYVSDLASPDSAAAFVPFSRFLVPALRRITRSPLVRARHWPLRCAGPTEGTWCADCESTVDDLLLASYNRFRRALTGDMPRTKAGAAVRELQEVVNHVHSPHARGEALAPFVPALSRAPRTDDPGWLRASRAQLVHYPARHLEERVRREDAVARGGSARPDRDLRKAIWAAPLRSDRLALELLLAYIARIRRGARSPFTTPSDLLTRLAIDTRTANQKLTTALSHLRQIRPEYYAANVTAQLAAVPLPLHHDLAAGPD